ncbi:hypothetical protein VNO77_01946 [Canavalia gladiata]|uniref:Uncharacterized protein n=1 Tax=Canavalia gladiata TaxID=3824 RepID=A0AAN9R5N7_CANGL
MSPMHHLLPSSYAKPPLSSSSRGLRLFLVQIEEAALKDLIPNFQEIPATKTRTLRRYWMIPPPDSRSFFPRFTPDSFSFSSCFLHSIAPALIHVPCCLVPCTPPSFSQDASPYTMVFSPPSLVLAATLQEFQMGAIDPT